MIYEIIIIIIIIRLLGLKKHVRHVGLKKVYQTREFF